MSNADRWAFDGIFEQIDNERVSQDEKWGEQSHPDMEVGREMAGHAFFNSLANQYKQDNDRVAAAGTLDWPGILLEEVYEALAESDPIRLREELIQSAAVIVAWIEDIDRRPPRSEVFSWGAFSTFRSFQ